MHHLLREKLMLLAATALLRPRAEAHTYEEAKLRADITLWLDARQHTIDVTVTHALRRDYLTPPDSAVARIEREKEAAMRSAGSDGTHDHVAAFDTFAGMTPKTARLMKKIARAYSARSEDPREAGRAFWAAIASTIVDTVGSRLAGVAYAAQ